jgi:hypothetical protein
MDPIQQGTVGLPIRLVLLDAGDVYDPALADTRAMTLTLPDHTSRALSPVTAGTTSAADGARPCLEYLTVAGDLEQTGRYIATGHVTDIAGSWPAAPVEFRVHKTRKPTPEPEE